MLTVVADTLERQLAKHNADSDDASDGVAFSLEDEISDFAALMASKE